jgi:O-antigen/teichoic acid export membrane protein
LTRVVRWAAGKARQHNQVNWALADQALVSGINFLAAILLVRLLGLAEFGRFTLAWIAVELSLMIQQSLIISPLMSIGPSYSGDDRAAYNSATLVQMGAFLCISAVFFAAGFAVIELSPLDWSIEHLFLPVAAAAIACQLQNYMRRYLFVTRKPRAGFIVDLVRYGSHIGLLFALVPYLGLEAPGCLLIAAGSAIASSFIGFFSVERFRWDPRVFREALSRNWHFSKWLLTSELLRWATVQLYITVAGVYLGAAAVGMLRAAQNILGACNIFLLAMENFAPARAAERYRDGGIDGLIRYLTQLVLYGSPIIGGITLLIAIAPDFWFDLIYGTSRETQGYIIQCWAVFYCITFVNYPLGIGLRTIEATNLIFRAFLLSAIISVVSVVPMVKYLGVPGVLAGVIGIVTILMLLLTHGLLRARTRLKNP